MGKLGCSPIFWYCSFLFLGHYYFINRFLLSSDNFPEWYRGQFCPFSKVKISTTFDRWFSGKFYFILILQTRNSC
jgi:hypothetical protein